MTKILVTYATKGGSTAEVAEAIGQSLRKTGAQVDVTPAKQAPSPDTYDAVVLGSGIWANKAYADVVKYAQRNQDALARLPVATFVLCAALKEDTKENRAMAAQYAATLLAGVEGIEPVSVGLFAGAVDFDKIGWLMSVVLKLGFKEQGGDYRDWDAIRGWARAIAPKLVGKPVAV
jgi:menaquinone-dependent protoporphyrinogen oxidase